MSEKIIGILGGMGPEATVDLFSKIIKATPAKKDQEHLRIIVYNNPKIPDRTEAILGKGENPLPLLIESAEVLKKAGVDFIVIPCITAHHYIKEIEKTTDVIILHMIKETVRWIQKNNPDIKKIGLIATTGTISAAIFQKEFVQTSIELIIPDKDIQENIIMKAIYGEKGIKAGYTTGESRKLILDAAIELITEGAEAIIAGCTEVPLVLKEGNIPVPVIDPVSILAYSAVKKAYS